MSTVEPGLLDALTRLGANLFGVVQNRLELASIELGEARGRLVVTLVAAFGAVLLLSGSLLALSAWAALALWSALGHAVLAWIALAYFAVGAGLALWLRSSLLNHPPLLADTLAELRNDAAFLRGDDLTGPNGAAPKGSLP